MYFINKWTFCRHFSFFFFSIFKLSDESDSCCREKFKTIIRMKWSNVFFIKLIICKEAFFSFNNRHNKINDQCRNAFLLYWHRQMFLSNWHLTTFMTFLRLIIKIINWMTFFVVWSSNFDKHSTTKFFIFDSKREKEFHATRMSLMTKATKVLQNQISTLNKHIKN